MISSLLLIILTSTQRAIFIQQIQDDAGDLGGMSQPSVSLICKQVALALLAKRADWIKMPQSNQDQNNAIAHFFSICGFRQVIGAIDCTHIRIPNVSGNIGQYYINRKGFSSLNVQVSLFILYKCNIRRLLFCLH